MTRLMTTTACIAALTVPAFAGTEGKTDAGMNDGSEIEQAAETAVETTQEMASEAVDHTQEVAAEAAQAAGNTAEDVAQATENSAAEAADATESATRTVAETARDAAGAAVDTAKKAADATIDAAQDAAAATEKTIDRAAQQASIVMDDSWDADIAKLDAPMIERDGWIDSDGQAYTYDELSGMRVYTADDQWIGEIDNVVVNGNGDIMGAVLGVGGFIGIGEKDVLVSFDSLTLKEEVDGDRMRAYVDATEESLEALPAYRS